MNYEFSYATERLLAALYQCQLINRNCEPTPMIPQHYTLVYTEKACRIFVIISEKVGDFVLTKDCQGPDCGCIGCLLFTATVVIGEAEYSILDMRESKEVEGKLHAYPFTNEGGVFLSGLKKQYKGYKGRYGKSDLDKIFQTPDALLIIKQEEDGTFTHSYLSPTVDRRVISRGCRAQKVCPCVGCRIVDMWYAKGPEKIAPAVDVTEARSSPQEELILPIFEGHEIISKMLTRDPAVRHEFSTGLFDSPLEQLFYELAFLDLHIFPQHPVGKYRLDFAIPDKQIAIEIDGHEYHKTKYQRTHDAKRDRWLFGQGWHVLRFTGSEIYKNLDRCIHEICELVGVERLSTRPPATTWDS